MRPGGPQGVDLDGDTGRRSGMVHDAPAVGLGGPVTYIVIRGTSMLPTYQPGDLVLVGEAEEYGPGDVVAYQVPEGEIGEGMILIPSSLDQVETSILAAALETIDRVGPCKAAIRVEKVEDVRVVKRNKIIERARALLSKMVEDSKTTGTDLLDEVRKTVQIAEVELLPEEPLRLAEDRADDVGLLDDALRLHAGLDHVLRRSRIDVHVLPSLSWLSSVGSARRRVLRPANPDVSQPRRGPSPRVTGGMKG